MTGRLVLGSHSLVPRIVESLRHQPGSLHVGTHDEHMLRSLRESGVLVTELDPTDSDDLADLDAEVVFVFEPTQSANISIARSARRAFPDAYLLVYTGEDTLGHDERLAGIADRVLDPGRETAATITERLGESGYRMRQLWQVLKDIDHLAVVTHDNPDPDAIASGIALARLAAVADCQTEVCYYGDITHQENRAFVNVLNLDLRNLEPDEGVSEFDGVALVDHSRAGVNDQLAAGTPVDIVIDHHPPRSPVDARFVDLRSDVGATSTLLVDYLQQFGTEIDEDVATALLFGIHVDTKAFSREVALADFEAAATLVSAANLGLLERIESPSISTVTFDTIASAIQNRRLEGEVLLSCVGQLSERDALAQAAERLLMLDAVSTTLVYGIKDGTVFVSARSRGTELDLGETLREAFDQIGSAGGHVDMAGAQITLGVLEAVDDRSDSLEDIVEEIIADRFLEAVEAQTGRTVTGVYATDRETEDEYVVPDSERESEQSADSESTEESTPDEE